MRQKTKGQSSVEYLTLLIGFIMFVTPLVLFLMSYGSMTSQALKEKQLSASATLIKSGVEDVFSNCPEVTSVSLNLPDISPQITLRNNNGNVFNDPYLEVKAKDMSYLLPLSIRSRNLVPGLKGIRAYGNVSGNGIKKVVINCSIVNDTAGDKYMLLTMGGYSG